MGSVEEQQLCFSLPPIQRTKGEIFAVDQYVSDLGTASIQVQTAIERSQEKHRRVADKHLVSQSSVAKSLKISA